jgi:hypothetical protein
MLGAGRSGNSGLKNGQRVNRICAFLLKVAQRISYPCQSGACQSEEIPHCSFLRLVRTLCAHGLWPCACWFHVHVDFMCMLKVPYIHHAYMYTISRVGQNHVYVRCIYSTFGREITKYMVIYGVYIRFWPTLPISLYPWFWPTLLVLPPYEFKRWPHGGLK